MSSFSRHNDVTIPDGVIPSCLCFENCGKIEIYGLNIKFPIFFNKKHLKTLIKSLTVRLAVFK